MSTGSNFDFNHWYNTVFVVSPRIICETMYREIEELKAEIRSLEKALAEIRT